jgi:WD40 repeat protein
VQKTPRGDGIFYTKGPVLFLFRLYGTDSIALSRNFSLQDHPLLISDDGSAAAFLEKGSIGIVNIPSGDIFYLISMDTEGTNAVLTDFNFLLAKGKKVFVLQHKKTGQALRELFTYDEDVTLLASSPDDRYIAFQGSQKHTLLIYDQEEQEIITKPFTQGVERVMFAAEGTSCYVVTRSNYQEYRAPVRELFFYDFQNGIKTFVSTTTNADVKLYLRNE